MRIKFEVPGNPVAKARARVTKHGTYTPKKTRDCEDLVKYSYMSAYSHEPIKCPIRVDVMFFMQIPKSDTKKAREDKLAGLKLPTVRPDIDNLTKSITDALNGLAYVDDNQIVELHCYKHYSNNPKAVVEITKLGG